MTEKTTTTIDLTPISAAIRKAIADGMQSTTKRVSAIGLITNQLWAIKPDALEMICSIAARENEDPQAVAAKMGRPLVNTRGVTVRDGVAIIPVNGPVFRYANLFTEISGATSLEILARDFTQAVEDPAIKAIVLEIDSPGGQASGIAEFADMVRAADKPVTAYVDGIGASAAYWIAAAADEVVVSKTGMVGSIGAVIGFDARKDDSYIEIVSSQSPRKRPDVTTDDGRKQIQTLIDALAQVFIEDVANFRGVSVETVLTDFGQGDIRMGEEAVTLNMADRVSTLEQVIAGLAGTTDTGGHYMATTKGQPAADDKPAITREYLAEHHPDIVQAIAADAAAGARAEGIADERARVTAIMATPLANVYGDITNKAISDGITPEQTALAILAAEAKGRTDTLAKQKADAPKPVNEPANSDDLETAASGSVEDRAKANWDKDAALHDEFGTLDRYLAYMQVEEKNKRK